MLNRDRSPGNWPARTSLSLVGASWIALFLRLELDDVYSINSPLDWFYVFAAATAVVAGLAGLIATRWRGQPVLAIGAFLLSILLPTLYTIYFWPTGNGGAN